MRSCPCPPPLLGCYLHWGQHGLNWVSPLVPLVPGSNPIGIQPLSRCNESLWVVLSKAFIDTFPGQPPGQGFIAWRPDPSCHDWKSMPPAHLVDRWPWPAGRAGVNDPINTSSLIKTWRLSAGAQCRSWLWLRVEPEQDLHSRCSPPEEGSGCFLLRSQPKLMEDTAKENLVGRPRAFRLFLTPWGACVSWGDPVSSPKTRTPACQGTWSCSSPSPGHPQSPTLPCSPRLP